MYVHRVVVTIIKGLEPLKLLFLRVLIVTTCRLSALHA